jgi:K+ transporter
LATSELRRFMFFSAIVGSREIEPMLVLGGLSAVFWTLTLQTTLKYVLFVLSADNNGEGGVFSLYTLVRQHAGKWILFPAILGGSFILAEGIITRRFRFPLRWKVCGFTRLICRRFPLLLQFW